MPDATDFPDHEAFPLFALEIGSDEAGAQLFERTFGRTLAAGHDHLPVSISVDRRAERVEGSERFCVIQPVTSIRFEQSVSLSGRRR
ncbi:hypothetical protein [Methylobacterium haplocladii]|uniref:hypothetical protein n=1 Tax=Methylobacterium haplocladii TaxID=1176176 RepID=UPI001EE10EE5|nr:hypothetical protein [Methylobacterium haplocladii]